MQSFEAGQVWRYRTRPGEGSSRVIICRVEADPKMGEVVHVRVVGLRLRNGRAPGGYSGEIGHMPYAAEALRESVTELEASGVELPAFGEGYRQWRDAFDAGRAGVWTLALDQAIEAMEGALNG